MPRSMPRDQADGLRRLFGRSEARLVPIVAQPGLDSAELLLDALVGAYLERGLRVLVVDAGARAPVVSELARLDLASCIESLGPAVRYLSARGLVGHYLDAQGRAGSLLAALRGAAPEVDLILLHAGVAELARVLDGGPTTRPVLLAGLEQQSVTEAYAAMKWLRQRAGCQVFGLLLAADERLALSRRIATQLADCAERFCAAALPCWAGLDPRAGLRGKPTPALRRLARDSLMLETEGGARTERAQAGPPRQAWA